ncbi:aspartyl-phosphate phosphatase Spo0E family protein [Anaerobacillus arseniciselenatis]|uniref:aspartyl-phosphate phosphatase Spo0E family protein n=1 Tax=Anaerobacillus arseniciselenatis TaxID=85682 RepID=UPI000A0704CF|nr:aspartyl-phosphate phosphatase Spo0E family protein [Anaerobacillus arseniciselenatis]
MNNKKLKDIELEINTLRSCMISKAQLKGINHPETIKISQDLDILLNDYQQLRTHENKK